MVKHQRQSIVIVTTLVTFSVHQLALAKFSAGVWFQLRFNNRNVIKKSSPYTCSQGTFAAVNLMNQIDINGIQTLIGIRTLIVYQKQLSYMLDSLSISKLVLGSGEKANWIRLPSTFTRKDIPVDQSSIVIPAKQNQSKHLKRVLEETGGMKTSRPTCLMDSFI